jgi:hypothetical protein
MLLHWLALALVGTALVVLGVGAGSRWLAAKKEHDDAPGVRSAATFVIDDDPEAIGAVLARLGHALEAIGADHGSFDARGAGFELDGVLGESAFRVTVARLDESDDLPPTYLLLLHARTLGRYRYVAPPATATTHALLQAMDEALASCPEVASLAWRTRQDEPASFGG